MKKSTAVVMSLLCALPMTFITPSAFAQQSPTDMQKVEVKGRKLQEVTRFDVSKVCPGVAQSLQDSLGLIAYRESRVATVRMQFRLNANKLEDVAASAGTPEYRRAARRAVLRLDCADAAGSEPQQFSFLISFNRPDDEAGGSSRVALLER